jgi:hypothetical protein
MVTIRITADEACSVTDKADPDGLPVFLRRWGLPPLVIQDVLRHLPQGTALLLYQPSEDAAWEIRVEG